MQLISSRTVPASVEATWAALNDPETLKACIPGCETIERASDTEFRVAMTARVGPVSAKFTGRIILADLRLSFEGQGGGAGFARGEAKVALAPEQNGTRIEYTANAQVGGKLAQIGSRLVDAAAAKVADDFFARFVERVGGPGVAAPPPTEAPSALRALWWRLALAAAIIAAIAIYWLTR
ncbi:MAG: carbon monoxide dehydrogenase subunit G [Betaproteobacteria bacterium]|nr:MAG: carbon monoxide dehydrogenase subunit G [Betaproteobacteria bacterium]